MIPSEVSDIAKIVESDLITCHPDDPEYARQIAWALYNAGYRKVEEPS